MAKKISLSLCLLTSIIFAGVPAQAAMTAAPTAPHTQFIAQQGIAETVYQMAAEQTASKAATLTAEDLPPGFTALPPELAAEIASRLEVLREQLGQGSMKPENFFAFVNQQSFQLVLGFTGNLADEPQKANFDASLAQLKQPEGQQRMLGQLQDKLKTLAGINVTDYRGLPELNNLANASTGVTLALDMQGQPLRLDFAAFRRDTTGAFTAVLYTNGGQPAVKVDDVARKLDGRIVQLSANANRSTVATVR